MMMANSRETTDVGGSGLGDRTRVAWIKETGAEEGRRRLPPFVAMSRESTLLSDRRLPSVHFNRDNAHAYQGPSEELETSHWHVNHRPIKKQTDVKIVNHLRKSLNRRIERRYNKIYEDEQRENLRKQAEERRRLQQQKKKKTEQSEHIDIFQKYSEFGEKINGSADHKRSHSSNSRLGRPSSFSPKQVTASKTSAGRSRSMSPRKQPSSNTTAQMAPAAVPDDSKSQVKLEHLDGVRTSSGKKAAETSEILDIIDKQTSPEDVPTGGMLQKTPLPGIGDSTSNSQGGEGAVTADDQNNLQSTPQNNDDKSELINDSNKEKENTLSIGPEREHSVFTLTRTKNNSPTELEDQNDDSSNFRKLAVSPVPTPSILRPMTREKIRVDMEDRIDRILQGRLDVLVPPDHRIIKIYISSEFTDTEAERSALIEKVYPKLRQYSREHGVELHVFDLHWGLRDTVIDNHSLPEIFLKTLESCQEQNHGITFVSFLCQKYGLPILPLVIPADEFNAILEAAERDKQMRDAIAQAKQRALKEAREAAERIQEEEENEEEVEGNDDERTSPQNLTTEKKSINQKKREADSGVSVASDKTTDNEQSSSNKIKITKGADENAAKPNNPNESKQSPRKGKQSNSVQKQHNNGKVSQSSKEGKLDSMEQEPPARAMQRRDTILIHNALREAESDPNLDPSLLKNWYKYDTNSSPPMYVLQSISSHDEDINKTDAFKRKQAKAKWLTTCRRIQIMLQKYSSDIFGDESSSRRFFMSIQDLELDQALLGTEEPERQCVWFHRTLNGLEHNLDDDNAKKYIDLHPFKAEIDSSLQEKLKNIVHNRLKAELPQSSIHKYKIQWTRNGVDPNIRSHAVYIDKMCQDFEKTIKQGLEDYFEDCQYWHESQRRLLYDEVSEHVKFCQARAHNFHGRKDHLSMIKSYIRSTSSVPLLIYGSAGCGKTSLIAKAARECHKWFHESVGEEVAVVARFIGVTGLSRSIRLLLQGICRQLCEIYHNDPDEVPEDYKGTVNDFGHRLSYATENKPLVIFIDCLDQLTDENSARKLAWLPKELPPNVHMVVSTLPNESYGCKNAFTNNYPNSKDNIIEITELPVTDAEVILKHWLNQSNRTLTQEQLDLLLDSYCACPVPLYLYVAFKEALRWQSYTPIANCKLGKQVKNLAVILFGRLEKEHGEPLVRRALGYITAAKNGVTHCEMEDLLSLDEAVMDDVTGHYSLQLRRFPPILWARLRNSLGSYLSESSADGSRTLVWFNVQFREAATERYLNARDKAPSYHKALAEYFSGKWASVPKPHGSNKIGALRWVADQPLKFQRVQSDSSEPPLYNTRKLNELPHHFLQSQQFDTLKSECLCNFEWVSAKLLATSFRAVLDDFHSALEVEPKDKDIKLLTDTFQLSGKVLSANPIQLASQMVGRLHNLIAADVPMAPQDPVKYPYIRGFLRDARNSSVPSLIPSATCLTPPGGMLFDILSGHTEPITAVTTTTDGMRAVTTSKDNTMKLWDLRTGRVTKTIDGVGKETVYIRLGNSNRLAISSELRCIRIYDLNTSLCQTAINGHEDIAIIATVGNGVLLVAFFDGANKMRSWDLQNNFQLIQDVAIEGTALHKDRSVVVASNPFSDKVLYAHRGRRSAKIVNARTGAHVHTLKCQASDSASIQAVAVTGEYYVVATRNQYMKLHEIHYMELFDTNNGKYIRAVRGCTLDFVEELYVNQMGSHTFSICRSEANNTSNIAVWNLETEDHKHLAHHAGASTIGACCDFRFCLTAAANDNAMRIWNLSLTINKQAPKLKRIDGIGELVPMQDHPRYVVAKALNNGPVTVWNVAKGKSKGTAVRIERGLSESSDIMLLRNTRVCILTDLVVSAETGSEVYRTVLIYDLRTKKYVNKVHSFMPPFPAHEYLLMNDNLLLSPSDNRSHFVVWSLEHGKPEFRIKPNFKDRTKLDMSFSKQEFVSKRKRNTTAKMTPWERRSESPTSRRKRREKEVEEERRQHEGLLREKENSIEQFVISGNQKIIVASFYAHHLCVFDIEQRAHIQTLENENSMLLLHTAAISYDGSHLVHANYDEEKKTSYVTLWDCMSGHVRKRLKNERNVCAIAISDAADRVVFAKTTGELRIWDPLEHNIRRVKGYPGLQFTVNTKILLLERGARAVVHAGDISVWDLNKGSVLAVFTPDKAIICVNVAMDDKLIVFGVRDSTDVVILKLMSKDIQEVEHTGENIFDEGSSSSSEDDEDDDEENASRKS
ncbi:uncharacterized protein LOC106180985 isoform X2 [Lingula anatina]|uniref:Uncharacterized protein LOC106180985 isoform X2 n=1 Tax=Lingula anatina TaxID=7574 RepID=A0A1S3KDY9_LINAN|nr:uncharacterized protein LOC106180985 isoform X2 [Lingula anatina]|eukprot:XP_013420669.1 uncharacterized protein LOC106180985 isoform X2 [Lingula anatina]